MCQKFRKLRGHNKNNQQKRLQSELSRGNTFGSEVELVPAMWKRKEKWQKGKKVSAYKQTQTFAVIKPITLRR